MPPLRHRFRHRKIASDYSIFFLLSSAEIPSAPWGIYAEIPSVPWRINSEISSINWRINAKKKLLPSYDNPKSYQISKLCANLVALKLYDLYQD